MGARLFVSGLGSEGGIEFGYSAFSITNDVWKLRLPMAVKFPSSFIDLTDVFYSIIKMRHRGCATKRKVFSSSGFLISNLHVITILKELTSKIKKKIDIFLDMAKGI